MAGPASAPVANTLRRFLASGVLLLVGASATIAAFVALRTAEIGHSERLFTTWTSEQRDLLQSEVDSYVQVLLGVRALYDSSESVSADEFKRYTRGFLLRHPYMYSLDWMPRVKGKDRLAFETHASELLGVAYRILEATDEDKIVVAGQRSEYWPLLYSESRDRISPLGLDPFKRPAIAEAMKKSLRTNQPNAVRLRLQRTNAPSIERVFVYVPIIDRHSNEAEGFVRTSISIDEMLRSAVIASARKGVDVRIVHEGANDIMTSPGKTSSGIDKQNWRGGLNIADLRVELEFVTAENFPDYPRLPPIYGLLVAGLAVSILGAIAVYHLTRRRLRLQSLTRELLMEVSERRQSEQRLSSSETRYRVLVENSPDAILLHQQGRITYLNKAGARLLGVQSLEGLVGESVYDLVHPDYHETIRSRLSAMAESAEVLPPVELVLMRADGTTVPVELNAVPFESETGTVIQVTARDITQRRAEEAERERLETALRHSQKLEALGTLAGGIAHDFNNILSAIIGNTRLLADDLPKSHPAARSVQEILSAAHRARDLIKRVAAFSRQQETQRTAVAVAPLIVEVQQLLRASLPAGVRVIARVPPDTPPIHGDATEIHQVLLNLCTNAWQAMPGSVGRIEIDVTTLDESQVRARVALPLDGAARYVCIAVRDNGAGMPAEVMEHIFDPFFTTKRPGENSGLGLAVVHGIVKGHRGAITAESRPNEGTTFNIYLPSCDAAPQTTEVSRRVRPVGEARHVLYIDDEEQLVFLVVRMLERAGYRCTGMDDAREAIELVRSGPQRFDFVVTDLNMPGMTGLDVARQLLEIRRDLPVLIMTGYVRADDVAAARALGVCDFVLKPDTIDELASVVQSHLQKTANERAAAVGGGRDK
jgi:PAS domain S-box-containing protein